MNKSIFLRLLFCFMITVLLGMCAVGLLMPLFARSYIVDAQKTDLLRKAKRINLAIQNQPKSAEALKSLLIFFDQSYDARVWLFDRSGKIIATSKQDEVTTGKSVDAAIVHQVLAGEDVDQDLHFAGLDQPMVSVAVPWGKDNQVFGGIVLHASLSGVDEAARHLREIILWVTLLGLILSLAIAAWLAWSISRPLQRIDRVAAKIGLGDYGERIVIPSKDEIGELAATINTMADKLEQTERERHGMEQLRRDFLVNVSHELRTPLTAVQGFLEALLDGVIDEEKKPKYYDLIYNETLHMNRLIDDITDLVRLQSDEITLVRYPLDLVPLLHKTAITFSQEAAEKRIALVVQAAEQLPLVSADPGRMAQILNNLVKNALKFTESGHITLGAEPDGGFLHLWVTDTGIGIAAADQELIWERFFKADRGRSPKNKGTGLGLAIVKELVELHDGEIRVESEPGRGTAFHIRIPAAATPPLVRPLQEA